MIGFAEQQKRGDGDGDGAGQGRAELSKHSFGNPDLPDSLIAWNISGFALPFEDIQFQPRIWNVLKHLHLEHSHQYLAETVSGRKLEILQAVRRDNSSLEVTSHRERVTTLLESARSRYEDVT